MKRIATLALLALAFASIPAEAARTVARGRVAVRGRGFRGRGFGGGFGFNNGIGFNNGFGFGGVGIGVPAFAFGGVNSFAVQQQLIAQPAFAFEAAGGCGGAAVGASAFGFNGVGVGATPFIGGFGGRSFGFGGRGFRGEFRR